MQNLLIDNTINLYNSIKKFKNVVFVATGGTSISINLFKNNLKSNHKLFVIDSLRSKIFNEIEKLSPSETIYVITSVSGKSREVNLIAKDLVKRYLNISEFMFLSSSEDNELGSIARFFNIEVSRISNVRQRYSVFCEPGLLSALLSGYDLEIVLKGFDSGLKNMISLNRLFNEFTFRSPQRLVLLNYNSELQDFLKWLQICFVESLSFEEHDFQVDILRGNFDEHCLMQHYLTSNVNSLFYVFSKESFVNEKYINIINAQKNLMIDRFNEKELPYYEIIASNNYEYEVAKLCGLFKATIDKLSEYIQISDRANKEVVINKERMLSIPRNFKIDE